SSVEFTRELRQRRDDVLATDNLSRGIPISLHARRHGRMSLDSGRRPVNERPDQRRRLRWGNDNNVSAGRDGLRSGMGFLSDIYQDAWFYGVKPSGSRSYFQLPKNTIVCKDRPHTRPLFLLV